MGNVNSKMAVFCRIRLPLCSLLQPLCRASPQGIALYFLLHHFCRTNCSKPSSGEIPSSAFPCFTDRETAESGFTLMEAAVYLVLLSLLCGLLYAGIASLAALGRKTEERSKRIIAISSIDETLRSSVARIRMPYWYTPTPYIGSDTYASVPFLDGEQAKRLIIHRQGKSLFIDDGEHTEAFDSIESISALPFADSNGTIRGLSVRVMTSEGISWTTVCCFGSVPFHIEGIYER